MWIKGLCQIESGAVGKELPPLSGRSESLFFFFLSHLFSETIQNGFFVQEDTLGKVAEVVELRQVTGLDNSQDETSYRGSFYDPHKSSHEGFFPSCIQRYEFHV